MPIWKEPILLLLMRSGISIVLPAVDMLPLLSCYGDRILPPGGERVFVSGFITIAFD
ncbi:hypothetical protein D3C72_2498940 [compost metagenome]